MARKPLRTDWCADLTERIHGLTIDTIFEDGLHEFIVDFIACNRQISQAIEHDYRFYA